MSLWQLNTNTVSSGIAETGWAIINASRCGDHVEELSLVRRSHDYHIRKASHEGDIKGPTVCRAIRSHKTSSVHSKSHR